MKLKNQLPMIASVFVTFFVLDFIIHQVLLKSMYMETAWLWRTPGGMQHHMAFMLLGQLAFAAFFCVIFTHGYKGRGWKEGARYGALMTGLMLGQDLVMYAVAPYPFKMIAAWVMLGLIESMAAGVVAASIYKK